MINIKQYLTTLLLLIAGAGGANAFTIGSKVATESALSSSGYYVIYQPRNACYIQEPSSGTFANKYYCPDNNTPIDESFVFQFISNGDGTYKIKNVATGNYMPQPTVAGIFSSTTEANAGSWNLQFDNTNGAIFPKCNDFGWNRSSSQLHATTGVTTTYTSYTVGTKSTGINVYEYIIYEVAPSTTALSEFTDKDLFVNSTAAASFTTGTWYVMSQRSRTSYVYEDVSSHTLKHTRTAPSGPDKANYCVRLVSGTDGKYYIQNGLGNYFGTIEHKTNVPTTALKQEQLNIGTINSTNGHYYVQASSTNVVLDANDFSAGDPSTVAGWNTTVPTSTGGNNDWAFYPTIFAPTGQTPIRVVYDTSGETNYGTWDSDKATWTSQVTSDSYMAGVTLTKSNGTFDKYASWNSHYNLAFKPSAANTDNTLTLTAPSGYVIAGYSLLAAKASSTSHTYTLTADNGSSITPAFANSATAYTNWEVTDINQQSTTITVQTTDASKYLAIADFVIYLKEFEGNTLTIQSPMAEATFTWNGESKTGQNVTFIYTGGTISDTNITVSYTGNEYTSPMLSQTTWDGTTSATVTCTLSPTFFSTNYGDKWVRIYSAKENSLVVDLAQVSNGAKTKMQSRDFFSPKQLWCFVGNASSFTLYNKAAGEDYVLVSGSASPGQNTTISLQPSASATNATWTLGDQFSASDAPGYSIYVNGANGDYGIHGWQSGNEVKYWGVSSGGSHFLIEDASGEVTFELDGLDPASMTVYTQNIAVLPLTIAGSSSETLLTKDNFATRTAYVPNNSELTFGTPKMFQNYGFTGYDGSNQTKTVTATATPQTVTGTFSVVRPDARYLWEPLRQNNADYYRIPAIVTAKNGDIIAINDRRFNNASDIGGNHHIDLIGVASSDNGQTWSNEFMIMDGDNGGEKGYGDAAVVADRESNKVLVMACGGNVTYQAGTTENHQSIDRVVLTKDGSTWSASGISVVTTEFYKGDLASCPAMFIGSGSITQSSIIKKGDYYRIYCAVLARTMGNYVLYSDDFGTTWTYLGSTSSAAGGDEAKVSELPDGSVLLSSRKSYGRYFNVWTWNDETYTSGSWGDAVATNSQTGGISFGSNSTNGDIRMIPAIKNATGEMVTLAMQSIPTGSGRSNVSIYYKELDPEITYTSTTIAQNWSSAFEITPHQSAYSSFNAQPDGRIAFFMEEAPKAITEAKVGYYMCYVPLTLDEITNNLYTGIATTSNVSLNVIGDASYATLYLPYDVTTNGSTKAYYIATTNNGYAQLTATGNEGTEIPALTAVVLVNSNAAAGTVLNSASGLSSIVDEENNLLKGTLTSMSLDLSDGTNYYSLGKKNDEIGFYKFDNNGTYTITLGANKAYLDTTAPTPVKGFIFSFGDETGISLTPDPSLSKRGEEIYDLSGRKVMNPTRGLYIVNGKKVIIK